MNGVTANSNKQSPKTPGGISKSLLTPCRRLGLSRKWKKGGCSPFISPLNTQNVTPEKTEFRGEKKRKKSVENHSTEVNSETVNELNNICASSVCSPIPYNNSNKNNDIISTPCRNTQTPRKKAKILSLSLKSSQDTDKDELSIEKQLHDNNLLNTNDTNTKTINVTVDNSVGIKKDIELEKTPVVNTTSSNEEVKPIRLNVEENVLKVPRTNSKIKKLSLKKSLLNTICNIELQESKPKDNCDNPKPKQNSPNNLTKECIVVIQNKIFKTEPTTSNDIKRVKHDSDSETVPLSLLKGETTQSVTLNTLDDNDFITKPVKKKVRNLSTIKRNKNTIATESNNTSQSSQEDMDTRTILVRKTYEKVIKPQKAKSTGSITQKDIDDLKARIEMKKKLLLAKAMSIDTEELRSLIKKWQKGCQDALIELLELMKKKLPDRQHMDYAEILETLKIPAQLVGYDSDNDCFITPDDTNVILSAFKL